MKLKINNAMLTKIISKELLQALKYAHQDYTRLMKQSELESWEEEDLADSILDANAFKRVYRYFNIDHSKLKKYMF